MKSFLVAWIVAFGLIAAFASGVSWYVGSQPQPTPVTRVASSGDGAEDESGPFTEADAVLIVGRRLPPTDSGDQLRRQLESTATVTHHSAQHWRVCFDAACWVAHGPGRYAEPENDAARAREVRPATPR